jgi:PPOX class probable F420-dependent enzyme
MIGGQNRTHGALYLHQSSTSARHSQRENIMEPFSLPAPETPFGARVARHLRDDTIAWLTSVSANGTPQPNPIWFQWDGASFLIYTQPSAARLRHIARNPRVSLNFDSDKRGNHIIVFMGEAHIAADEPSANQHVAYLAKYRTAIDAEFGGPVEFAADYSVPLRVIPLKVRGF